MLTVTCGNVRTLRVDADGISSSTLQGVKEGDLKPPIVYFIDVSQSVEHEHPRAMDFLRIDARNVTQFFTKKGLQVPNQPCKGERS